MKLDLRIICYALDDDDEHEAEKIQDYSSGEMAKAAVESKYYHDKTKLVTHAKMILNELVSKLGHLFEERSDTRVCLVQAMGKVNPD